MKKILVVVHIYYVDQLDLIIQSLKNIPIEYDLYVTIGTDDKQMVKKTLVAFKPDCHFISVDNVGYDVWPFIKVINQIDLSKYSYVIKLHTKRNLPGTIPEHLGNGFYVGPGKAWRNDLYAFIKTRKSVIKCLNALDSGNIGMCCRYNLKHDAPNHCGVMDVAKRDYPNYVVDIENFCFVAGTMFISRIEPIQMLKDMNITQDLFDAPNDKHTTQFAHVMERMLGACVYRAGMIIDDPFTSRRHISKILKLRRTAKRQKRLINLIVCPIFVAKYRRQLRQKLWNNYLNKFISFENDAGQGGQL